MNKTMHRLATLLTAALVVGGAACSRSAPQSVSLDRIESAYADFNDASGAISLIESGLRDSFLGKARSDWVQVQQQAREEVRRGLEDLAGRDLSPRRSDTPPNLRGT